MLEAFKHSEARLKTVTTKYRYKTEYKQRLEKAVVAIINDRASAEPSGGKKSCVRANQHLNSAVCLACPRV